MIKLFALVAAFAGLAVNQVPTLTVRVAGGEKEVAGTIVAGKDMVSLSEVVKLLGGQLEIQKPTPTDRIALITLAPPKPPFDDSADTMISVDGDTSAWLPMANSDNKLRVRDFVRAKDSWNSIGEIDVAKGAIMIQGRPPRDTMTLSFYVVYKDAAGKTLGRRTMEVKNVSFDGGRYPIAINLSRGDNSSALPASVGLRFNAATESERGE
jgi:hypothetical protein